MAGLSQTDRRFGVTYHNQSFDFDNQATLFQAIEDAALPINGDCRSGSCGMCKCKLMKGKVSYLIKPQLSLSEKEILPCCCIPETDLVLQ
jgi:ferredoxin